MDFQISEHKINCVFIGSSTYQVSENNGYYASVLGALFSGAQEAGFCMKEAN